jgi:NADH-quinone oxidoreductase subunit L
MSDEQDMRKMGGLASKLPWTHRVMLIGCIAIAGIPPFAGFFSKDEILHDAFASGHYGVWLVGLLGAGLTAFYMFRLYVLTFRGPSRVSHEAEHHLHESPPSMIVPLVVLAILSIVGGWVGLPFQEHGHVLAQWLAPVFESGGHAEAVHEVPAGTEWMLILVSVAVAAFGIFMAFRAYLQQPSLATSLRERFAWFHDGAVNKWWVDVIYDSTVVRLVRGMADSFWKFWDVKVVDGLVNGVGYTLEGFSAILRLFQTGFVGTYAMFFALGVVAVLLHVLRH